MNVSVISDVILALKNLFKYYSILTVLICSDFAGCGISFNLLTIKDIIHNLPYSKELSHFENETK